MSQLNQRTPTEVPFIDFSGGYAGAKGASTLASNEAQSLNNIILPPQGKSFKSRFGTKQISPVGGSSHNLWSYVTSVFGDREKVPGFDSADRPLYVYTMAKATAKTGGFDVINALLWKIDGTSSPALTSGGAIFYTGDTVTKDYRFSIFAFQGVHIITTKRGGTLSAGALPAKMNFGSVSLTALAGSPPVGEVGVSWNNVCWIGNTTSDPSKLYYSVLNSPDDWTGSGSGFVNPDPGSGDELMALAPISNNVMLYFKQNAIFQVVGRADPFAVFELFRGVGCTGTDAHVTVDGVVYFITPKAQMRITDGSKIYDEKDIPKLADADDLWQRVPVDRRAFIRGFRHKGNGFDHIVWLVTLDSGSTNNCAIVWDLINKCWLKMTVGYAGNCGTSSPEGRAFIGSYDGARIFELGVSGYYKDDPASTPAFDGNNRIIAPTDSPALSWLWRSDDLSIAPLHNIVQANKLNVINTLSGSGTLSLTYRYDGLADSSALSLSIVPTSTTHRIDTYRPLGRGQTFGFQLSGSSEVTYQINKVSILGSARGTKENSKGLR